MKKVISILIVALLAGAMIGTAKAQMNPAASLAMTTAATTATYSSGGGGGAINITLSEKDKALAGTLPSDLLWRLDIFAERLQLAFASPQEKVLKRLSFIEERIAEARLMIEDKNAQSAIRALDNAERHYDRILMEDRDEVEDDVERTALNWKIQYALSNQSRALIVLTAVYEKNICGTETKSGELCFSSEATGYGLQRAIERVTETQTFTKRSSAQAIQTEYNNAKWRGDTDFIERVAARTMKIEEKDP